MMTLSRGKFVIEPANGDGEILVLSPDGSVQIVRDATAAQRIVNEWNASATQKNGIGSIAIVEWRDVVPPQ